MPAALLLAVALGLVPGHRPDSDRPDSEAGADGGAAELVDSTDDESTPWVLGSRRAALQLLDRDGDGEIGADDLRRVAAALGEALSDSETRAMLRAAEGDPHANEQHRVRAPLRHLLPPLFPATACAAAMRSLKRAASTTTSTSSSRARSYHPRVHVASAPRIRRAAARRGGGGSDNGPRLRVLGAHTARAGASFGEPDARGRGERRRWRRGARLGGGRRGRHRRVAASRPVRAVAVPSSLFGC